MTLAKRIIPCLDVNNGRTVKGIRFENIKDIGDPVALASYYAENGADELVFLDITATNEKRKIFTELVTRIARNINIPFTVGGGIHNVADVYALLESGADKITVNSSAVHDPSLIETLSKAFGSQCIVLAIDAKHNGKDWMVHTHSGKVNTHIKVTAWAKQAEQSGAGEILLTSMNDDGMQQGFAVSLLHTVAQSVNIPLIASGGAGTMQHFASVFLEGNADGALAASVFHNKEIGIPELKSFLRSKEIMVRA